MARWKKAASEMEWAIGQARSRNHDRNPNRLAQVTAALEFGQEVAICARSDVQLPHRPDLDRAV